MRRILTSIFIALTVLCPPPAPAADPVAEPTTINVSYQPGLYWALPFYLATQKGWWSAVGLKPAFSTFPAGPPQIAASAAKTWDVGGTGAPPAVLGAARYNLLTIAVANDQSDADAMMVRSDQEAAFRAKPAALKGRRILVTTNSTAEYVALACLKKYGLAASDVEMVNLGQAQIISAFAGNNAPFGAMFAPYGYVLSAKAGARRFCSGKDAGVVVPGALVVREEYAKAHPDVVARFLALYLHAVAWQKAHVDETKKMHLAFNEVSGSELSAADIDEEVLRRPTFSLAEEMKLMDRSKGPSIADRWFGNIGEFMLAKGALTAAPDQKLYLTPDYLQMVERNPVLRKFATTP